MSSNSDEESMNLDASDTESDEVSEVSANESGSNDEEITEEPKTAEDVMREKIQERYKERNGKQLFIRFPAKLPADEKDFQKQVKALSPLITNAHKPRQKHARFCLADFKNQEDRDLAFKTIRASVKSGDSAFKGIVALIPRTENQEFVNELIKKKIENQEAKKAKYKLNRAAKRSEVHKHFTPSIIVNNLPVNVSMVEMRNLFPNAIDIQIKGRKGKSPAQSSMAVVTLSSTMEARAEVKKTLSLGGTRLSIRFDNRKTKSTATEKQGEKIPLSEKSKPATLSRNKKKRVKKIA